MKATSTLKILPCNDSTELADARQKELNIPRALAINLGLSAVQAAKQGWYLNRNQTRIEWGSLVQAACAGKVSIPPEAALPAPPQSKFSETRIQIANETTLGASRRLLQAGLKPIALNFANGITPGGGFLSGARAQEEAICRSSALHQTLIGDPMYAAHLRRRQPDSTDWVIYSPNVPVFRLDDGTELDQPWLVSFLTCAAPYAPRIGQPASAILMKSRIHRVLAVARAYGYTTLVLGAWGCGAFGNDPERTALDFRDALENDFGGAFSDITFAITDWSSERRFLKPFCNAFCTT